MKKALTARYRSRASSTNGSASTKTSISMDLLLVKVMRPEMVMTLPAKHGGDGQAGGPCFCSGEGSKGAPGLYA